MRDSGARSGSATESCVRKLKSPATTKQQLVRAEGLVAGADAEAGAEAEAETDALLLTE